MRREERRGTAGCHEWYVRGADEVGDDAAFAYEKPWPLARRLVRDRIAFWQVVEIAA